MPFGSRLSNIVRWRRLQRELDAELQFHLDARVDDLMADGMPRAAAEAEARRRFGSPLRWREQSLDLKLLPWLDSLLRDVRLGVRMLRRNAAMTAAAVASLSLALGGCVAAFSLIDALILRALPVRDPSRLVYLVRPTGNPERPIADSYDDPMFQRLRAAGRGYADLFAMSTQVIRPVTFDDARGERERVRTQYVSGDAFGQLGIAAAAGRTIAPGDDETAGASPVAVLSHAFWMRRFNGDPAVIGRWFGLHEDRSREPRLFQIVGVTEAGFAGIEPGRATDVWMPYAMYNRRAFGNPNFGWFRILARLRDGVRREQAETVLQAAFTAVRRERVPSLDPTETPHSIASYLATPLQLHSAANGPSPLRLDFSRALWVLGATAALVLLIAGSNVANLLLARTAARERELSLRLSIGAGRGRLIQQVLIESGLMAALACALGLLFAAFAAPAVVAMLAPPDDPVLLDLHFDWRIVGFAAVITLLTTALFGVVPALRASGVRPITAINAAGRSSMRAAVMRPFIALQVAFGLVVVFVGGLLVLSFARLAGVDPGFASTNVLLVSVEATTRIDAQRQRTAVLASVDHLRSVPGIAAATAVEFGVLGRAWTHGFVVPGSTTDRFEATVQPISDGYFETMRIPIVAGRGFAAADLDSGANAIVVNQAFVDRYYGDVPAVGRVLATRFADGTGDGFQIVGVAANARYDLRQPPAPTVYIPLTARGPGTIAVRVQGDATAATARVRDAVRAADPLLRATSIRTQAALVAETMLRERLLALLSAFFGIVGLLLAAVGLYGVLSYSVVQRMREIGIRLALGARRLAIVRTVIAEAATSLLIGGLAGLAGGLYLSRFVRSLLFEVTPLDFWSLALPLGALTAAALLAAAAPALRATRVDPIDALRHE